MTVVNLDKLKAQLCSEEGRKNKVYTDGRGIPTIGIGRNLRDVGLSDDEIDYLFQNDEARIQHELAANLPWVFDLDEVRLRTFYDLCFNMGIETLLTFSNTLALSRTGNWDSAADELQNSKWYLEVGDRGSKIVSMLRTGQDS